MLEQIEDRLVPAITVLWSNINDLNNGFNDTSVFGGEASMAKAVVLRAIADWQNVVVSFKGHSPFGAVGDVLPIKIVAVPNGDGSTHGGFLTFPDGSTGEGVVFDVPSANQQDPAQGTPPLPPGHHPGGFFIDPNPASNSAFTPDGSTGVSVHDPNSALAAIDPNQGSDLLTSALLEIGHTLGVIDNPTIWTSPKAVGVGDQHYFTQVYNLSLDTHNRIPDLAKTGSGKQIAPVTRIGLGVGTPTMFVDDPQGAPVPGGGS
jgi:hypothetical protein